MSGSREYSKYHKTITALHFKLQKSKVFEKKSKVFCDLGLYIRNLACIVVSIGKYHLHYIINIFNIHSQMYYRSS